MSGSKIQVDSIKTEENGSVNLAFGATLPSGQSISSSGGMNVVGIVTAASFIGDGSGITGITFASVSRTFAFSLLV